ncbi:MAG TPA: helix-turn-helix domain-containing protein [Pyrinomonadaceae bacterium]
MSENKEKISDTSELITPSDAAKIRGVSRAAVSDLIKRGRLSSYEIGGRTFVNRKEVEEFESIKSGRPPKAKAEKEKD